MPSCLVPGCTFSWRTRSAETILHVFPRKWEILQVWLEKIFVADEKMEDLMLKIHSSRKGAYRICSNHFTEHDYELRGPNKVLKKSAVPSMNLKPPVELHEDHPYSKRERLDEEMLPAPSDLSFQEPVPLDLSSQQAVPSLQDIELHPDQSMLSVTLTDAEDITTASDSESLNIEFMSVEEYQMEQMVESLSEYVESSPANPEPIMQKQKRKYTPRVRRTVGIVTKQCPTFVHKSTQYDKFTGKKNKIVQVDRRKPHMSVGVQCNLASLPALNKFEVTSGTPEADDEQKYINFVLKSTFLPDLPSENRSLEEFITSPSSFASTPFQQSQPIPLLSKNKKSEAPSFSMNKSDSKKVSFSKSHKRDESYKPCGKDDKRVQQELTDDELCTDPEDPDTSYIPVQDSAEPISYAHEQKYMVFGSCLDELLWNCRCKANSTCIGKVRKIKKYVVGSALVVMGVCSKDHKFRMWSSQPFIGRVPVGNLLLSGAIVCSGSHFQKMKDFFFLMCMPNISLPTHTKNQQKYVFPTIEHHWKKDRDCVVESLSSKPIALAGDGQCDPTEIGNASCSYIFMDVDTQKIVDLQVEQLQPGDSPEALEPKAFRIALDRLLIDKLNVKLISTNRHAGIQKILRSDYSNIQHKLDLWHLAKSIERKLQAASKEANCSQLSAWVVPAKNHLLWSASTCHQDPELLKEKWISIECHAANIHRWYSASRYHFCQHSTIGPEDATNHDWLQNGSAAHSKLKEIVHDSRLLGDLEQLPQICHTSGFEVFYCLAHKYRSKSHNICIDDMVAQSQLAILDHNHNISRMQAVIKRLYAYSDVGGVLHYHQSYGKVRKQWAVSKIYEPTNRLFLFDILADSVAFASGDIYFSWQSRNKDAL